MITNKEKIEILEEVLNEFLNTPDEILFSKSNFNKKGKEIYLNFGICQIFSNLKRKNPFKYTKEVFEKSLFELIPELKLNRTKKHEQTVWGWSPYGRGAVLIRKIMVEKTIRDIQNNDTVKNFKK